jgi:hypothetical protein
MVGSISNKRKVEAQTISRTVLNQSRWVLAWLNKPEVPSAPYFSVTLAL